MKRKEGVLGLVFGLFAVILLVSAVSAKTLVVEFSLQEKEPVVMFNDSSVINDYPLTAFTDKVADENKALEVVIDGVSMGKISYNYIANYIEPVGETYTMKRLYFNYTEGMNNLKILQNGVEKVNINLKDLLCDSNGKCENCLLRNQNCTNHYENALSCIPDCTFIGEKTKITNAVNANGKGVIYIIIILAGVIIVFAVIIFFIFKGVSIMRKIKIERPGENDEI